MASALNAMDLIRAEWSGTHPDRWAAVTDEALNGFVGVPNEAGWGF
jgi:hypothetical protein